MEQPFAFAVDKSTFVFEIRPTLVGAIQAARRRYSFPSMLVGITAWFDQGEPVELEWKDLIVLREDGRNEWISDEAAATLAEKIFPR